MAVATEKIIPGVLPPKAETSDIDFIGIYDSFDPGTLTDEQLNKFAPRYPYITAFGDEDSYYTVDGVAYSIPDKTIDERLRHGEFCIMLFRKHLVSAVASWEATKKDNTDNTSSSKAYKNARKVLIQAIGKKACTEFVKRKFESMSEEEKRANQESWDRWSEYCDEQKEEDPYVPVRIIPDGYTIDYDWRHDQDYIPVMSVKFKKLRKELKLKQRDFAKKIEYNVNKYALLEQGKLEKLGFSTLTEAFHHDLVKRVVDATYANPYWLENDETYDADPTRTAMTVNEALDWDPPMFASAEVIRYWWVRK